MPTTYCTILFAIIPDPIRNGAVKFALFLSNRMPPYAQDLAKPSLSRIPARPWDYADRTCAKLFEKSLDQKLLPWLAGCVKASQGKVFVHLFQKVTGFLGAEPLNCQRP
ncbi:hypothetical protein D7X94_04210 [Acutalibacter sp. 1XD8-33]|nr:hypothetical protein D7X94_04210 [Acutalibacter sp. 1XD8-33]